tara:strand:+ start:315 stop:1055 length:741 start_codon:yes stop_codon:yes gene_type:complete
MFPGVSKTIEQFPTKGLGGVTSVTYDPPTKKAYGRSYFSTSFTSHQSVVFQYAEEVPDNTFGDDTNVDNSTSEITISGGHGLTTGRAVFYVKDAGALLKNADGDVVVTDFKLYWVNLTDTNKITLHNSYVDAVNNTNKILVQKSGANATSRIRPLGYVVQANHGYKDGNSIVYDRNGTDTRLKYSLADDSGETDLDDLAQLYVQVLSPDSFTFASSRDNALNRMPLTITGDGHDTQKFHPTYGITS